MAPVLKGKSVGLDQKNSAKRRELLIWRTKNQAKDQGTSATQGFNSLQISPNWTLLDSHLKWACLLFFYNHCLPKIFRIKKKPYVKVKI
jgi:hypothetical protein